MNDDEIKPRTGILLMSPGNGFYNKENIDRSIEIAANSFDEVKILIPNTIYKYTLLAQEYSLEKATNKARIKGQHLLNKCKDGINKFSNVSELKWTAVENSKLYFPQLKKTVYTYKNNLSFQREARNNTQNVLITKLNDANKLEEAVNIGIKYLLYELPGFLILPELLEREKITICYHNHWPLLQNYLNGKYGNEPNNTLEFKIIN